MNYFINRSTNASAESLNVKIMAFRAQFRGVRNTEFFLFKLTQLFALIFKYPEIGLVPT
ncbi:transposase [Arenibacter hampyeongensis]|uniref:transposase n=1 Tax=Arenibacter TaxID=178469 RepID=UPI0021D47BF2|nr:transposase [Arenibacter sp. N53]